SPPDPPVLPPRRGPGVLPPRGSTADLTPDRQPTAAVRFPVEPLSHRGSVGHGIQNPLADRQGAGTPPLPGPALSTARPCRELGSRSSGRQPVPKTQGQPPARLRPYAASRPARCWWVGTRR